MRNTSGSKAASGRSHPLRRLVLVLSGGASIRNLLSLLKKLESENAAEGIASAVAALTSGCSFESVILDMRCATRRSGGEVYGIRKVQPGPLGKTLAITAEVNGPKSMKLIERYISSGLHSSLLWLVSHSYRRPQP